MLGQRAPQTLLPTLKAGLRNRLEPVRWLSLSEPELAREVKDLEADPLLRKLLWGGPGRPPLLRRNRWPRTRLHPGVYGLRDELVAGRDPVELDDLLSRHRGLFSIIRRIGQGAFERHFLYAEGGRPLAESCAELGLSLAEGGRIMDLVLELSIRSEFSSPPPATVAARPRRQCLAQILYEPGSSESPYLQFYSPHWARGLYQVDYERLEDWKSESGLEAGDRRRLRGLLRRIELINMRQGTVYRLLSRILSEQGEYLRTRDARRLHPLSSRELARRCSVASSTVSRALGQRSVVLPWGEEVRIKALLTSRRALVLSVLGTWMEQGTLGPGSTDRELQQRLATEAGIGLPLRTVNEYRRSARQQTRT